MSDYKAKHLADKSPRRNGRSIKESEKNSAKKTAHNAHNNDSGDIYSFVQCILESVMAAFLLLVFFINISVVSGSSMNPTLKDGDRILVAHTGYVLWYGDVVAVWAANLNNRDTGEMGELIVKRVIGLPGDVIYIDGEGRVYRNGLMLKEDYIMPFDVYENKGNASFPLTVEENCVFLLGDNRNHSTDSRFVDTGGSEVYVGCIDQRCIMGKAVYCLYPFDRMGVVK
ncbi:MAG: signal peptidase I [Ruminococcaceae bacterium]|nr:signal peptidase I [Oscillospiraceae bacterium]